MRRMGIFLLGLSLWLSSCLQDPEVRNYQTRNVILFVIDGPRWTETWGDPTRQLIPFADTFFTRQGLVLTEFHNEGVTSTVPGHIALMTGVYEDIANDGSRVPAYPSLFQYVIARDHSLQQRSMVITSKDKLQVLADCTHQSLRGKCNPLTDCGVNGLGSGYRADSVTMRKVMDALHQDKPRLLLVNLKDPDYWGHAGNWIAYRQAIRQSDTYLQQLVAYLQSDSFYAHTTTLVVVNDHGRHTDGVADGFISHGDGCSGCRHINAWMWGPDFVRGREFSSPCGQTDITVTLAHLLGIKMPFAQGDCLHQLLK